MARKYHNHRLQTEGNDTEHRPPPGAYDLTQQTMFPSDLGLHSLHLSHKKDAKLIWVKCIMSELSDRRTRRCKTHTEPGYKITCPLGNISVLYYGFQEILARLYVSGAAIVLLF